MTDSLLDDTEGYIRREYGEELPIIRSIVWRIHGRALMQLEEPAVERMVLEIVGYYTGCLDADGRPRIGRPSRRSSANSPDIP